MEHTEEIDWEQYKNMLQERAKESFWDFLGCEFIGMEGDEVKIALNIRPHHHNPSAILHGGVSATLLDNTMGIAVMLARPNQKLVTTNLNIHYVAQVKEGIVYAYGNVIHQSRKILTTQGSVKDEQGNLIAHATASYRIIS